MPLGDPHGTFRASMGPNMKRNGLVEKLRREVAGTDLTISSTYVVEYPRYAYVFQDKGATHEKRDNTESDLFGLPSLFSWFERRISASHSLVIWVGGSVV